MPRATPILLVLCLSSLAFAGCIELPGAEPGSDLPPVSSGDGTGTMTAEETREDAVAPCVSGGAGFCATRIVTVHGSISGIPMLEVDLATFNGEVTVKPSSAGSWGFVATLRARSTTPESAEAARDQIDFSWAHERGGAHFLEVKGSYEGRGDDASRGLDIVVSLPPEVVLRLVAQNINGDMEVRDVRTDGISVTTTNGRVTVDVDASQVDLQTTNGEVQATIRTTESGRINAKSVNGEVELRVAESATRGYDLHGRTTNGEVEIGLQDGDVGPCPQGSQYYTPPCNERRFKTSGYDGRATRTLVSLSTTNGDVSVMAI